MKLKEKLVDFSLGNDLDRFWRLFRLREKRKSRFSKLVLTFFINRSAHRHGGYIGFGAVIEGRPSLPHGLHGIYISRYARIGESCRIYQNVTIGEVNGKAPRIGSGCLIGAGACVVGDVRIGNNAKIGAGAVVAMDVPENGTVVAQPPRIIVKE